MASDVKSPTPRWTEGLEVSSLLRHAAEPGWMVVDAAGVIRAVNREAGRMLRRPVEEVLQRPMTELPDPVSNLCREVLRGGGDCVERLVALPAGPGGHSGCQAAGFRWQDGPGGAVSVLLVLQDLESARELELKTDRLQKLATVGTLSAAVAHEIKNALVAIKTSADLLLEDQPELETAALMRREVGRIDSLVTQLLRFAGPARPQMEAVHLHAVLSNALRLIQHQLVTRRIEQVLLLDSKEDRVRGDAQQLEQALLNLLLNAVESMKDGGRLVVQTELVVATEHVSRFEPDRREQQIQVEIRDTGSGIPPEVLQRMFTPFLTTKPGGTGLGLAITHRIVKEHRGAIKVSTHPGRGTTFQVLLPILRED